MGEQKKGKEINYRLNSKIDYVRKDNTISLYQTLVILDTMILEDFYTVINSKTTGENSFEVSVQLNKDHKIYKGHFPDNPVTPGVSMLQIIKNCLEMHFQTKLFLSSAANVKFLKAVDLHIDSNLIFSLSYIIEKEFIMVKNHTSLSDGTAVLKCNAKFVRI